MTRASASSPPRPQDRAARSPQFERLTQVSRAFTYAMSLSQILELTVTQAAEMLAAEKAILLLTDDKDILRVRASHGLTPETVADFGESFDESLIKRIQHLLGTRSPESFVGVPLVSQGNVIGLLAVVRADGEPITTDDEWLLSALADQVAAPLENARLAEELERTELISENGRLFQSERGARQEAEAAREEAVAARLQAELAKHEAEVARDLALASDRSKAAFLAAMSHDLRTPLNAIGGYVQLLKMGLRGPVTPEQALDLERIEKSQQHLFSLVSEVLDFATIGAGRVVFRLDNVVVDEALRNAESMVMPQIRQKGIHFEHSSPDSPITCFTDGEKLQQILVNLLSNAMKFTSEGGSIGTALRLVEDSPSQDGRVVEIDVSDTGLGIPEDQIDSVFLPFVQINRSLNHPHEGIGLGLAISRQLARGLGGDLMVRSEPDKGSTFTLSLPVTSKV